MKVKKKNEGAAKAHSKVLLSDCSQHIPHFILFGSGFEQP